MSSSYSPTSVPPQAMSNLPANNSAGITFFGSGGSVTAPTSGNSNPLISQDGSGFSQYTLGQISGNAVTLGISGLPSGPTTIGQALQDFMDLSPQDLLNLEMQLHDAGFYQNGDGSPMSAQDIRFGVPGDPASWTAFTRALAAASASGVSLTALLQGRSQMGAGINQALPSAVTGGGNTYTIDLSNPETVKLAADQIFQSALGRNATSDEVSKITDSLRSQETAQGLAQEQGKESSSKQVYQAQVNQRNIAYENQTNPNIGGQVPTGPFNTPQQWASALLTYMHMPTTTSNIAAISAWVEKTGKFSDGSFNPLGTSRPEGGSQTGSNGQQQFQNWAQGLEGTASMLMNGHYQNLVSALQQGNGTQAVQSNGGVKQELNAWSGGSFSSLTVSSQDTSNAATVAAQAKTQAPTPDLTRNQDPNYMGPLPGGGDVTRSQAPNYMGPLPSDNNAVSATLQAGATNPAVGAYLTAGYQAAHPSTVSPADVAQGQQPPNPGDAYVNPVTVYSVDPASESAAAYQEATTGANRIAYGGNQYLNAYQAVLAMIKAGGPTS